MQRELLRRRQVERARVSGIVGALVRGLVKQVPDRVDQRRKLLRMTPASARLWQDLPDLGSIHTAASDGMDQADLAMAVDVRRTGTERLGELSRTGTTTWRSW